MSHTRRELFRSASAGIVGAGVGGSSLSFIAQPATSNGFEILVAASNAPASMQAIADFVCTGTADQNQINAAVNVANQSDTLGGVVRLSPGTFKVNGPILLRKRVSLIGCGRASRIESVTGGYGGVIRTATAAEDKISISHLAIHGLGQNINGILLNATSNAGFDEGSPDAANYVSDVYVSNVGLAGIAVTGARGRASMVTRVRVLNAGTWGFNITAPDGFYSQCESGSSGFDGFRVANGNNRFVNCKAWFADRSGFEISANRNQFSGCEAQDNQWHGFSIRAGQVSLSACHADSNSWNSASPTSSFDGFFVHANRGFVQLVGCQAYDKNESNRGFHQRYGFHFGGNNSFCQVTGAARDNVIGKLKTGTGTGNSIEVVG